jgi:hypothetical protein
LQALFTRLVLVKSHLVLLPVRFTRVLPDFSPEFDREERRSPHVIIKYRLAIRTKVLGRYYYSFQTVAGLPKLWVKEHSSRLKSMRIIEGLIPSMINRKTMPGNRAGFSDLVKTSHRLLSANSHYHDDPDYVQKGRSVYRDMSLISAAIVGGTVLDVDQHF